MAATAIVRQYPPRPEASGETHHAVSRRRASGGAAAPEAGGRDRPSGAGRPDLGSAEDATEVDGQGLVTCAKTGRTQVTGGLPDDLIAQIWQPAFPSTDLVSAAANLLPAIREAGGRDELLREGPRWEITIGPGVIAVGTRDYARLERTAERQREADRKTADMLAAYLAAEGEFPEDPEPSRTITGWSRKSRNAMFKRSLELDYAPLFADPTRLPAMITLTYPGDWLTVAASGKVVKAHLKALRKRYVRAWGEDLACIWKLEFQRRGAPHIHMLAVPPHGQVDGLQFRQWLSRAWADVVAHPDLEEYRKHLAAGTGVDYAEGLRARDPRRVAVYFTKHGHFAAKEYQHEVPKEWQERGKGPGRFWGYWVLEPATATVLVDPALALRAGRTLRRWAHAQGVTRQVTRMRVEQSTGRIRYRRSRTRAVRLKNGRGWVSVNDGPAMASQLARYLDL